ncbi:hypothetical protein FGG79_11770 [Bacillus sp. BHET2]|nr:hypothetical protein FGG79_11770 [Bacillus sp. BHET2]
MRLSPSEEANRSHIKVSQYLPTIADMYVHPVEETTILQTIRNWEKEGAKRIEEERRNPRPRPAPPWER